MSEPLPTIDYMSQYKGGLPPDSRLRLEQTTEGISIILPPRHPMVTTLTVILVSIMLMPVGMGAIDAAMNGDGYRRLIAASVACVCLSIFSGLIIRRKRIPVALAISGRKLYAITPDQFQFRREVEIDDRISARAMNVGLTLAGESPAQLIIEREGRLICVMFRNLRRSEIDWVAQVVNSALAQKCQEKVTAGERR